MQELTWLGLLCSVVIAIARIFVPTFPYSALNDAVAEEHFSKSLMFRGLDVHDQQLEKSRWLPRVV